MSSTEFREFWISTQRIDNLLDIRVGRPGESAFANHAVEYTHGINYVAFANFGNGNMAEFEILNSANGMQKLDCF